MNATADPHKVVELTDEDVLIEFSYSASWEETGLSSFSSHPDSKIGLSKRECNYMKTSFLRS